MMKRKVNLYLLRVIYTFIPQLGNHASWIFFSCEHMIAILALHFFSFLGGKVVKKLIAVFVPILKVLCVSLACTIRFHYSECQSLHSKFFFGMCFLLFMERKIKSSHGVT